jgi:hypothetical protein
MHPRLLAIASIVLGAVAIVLAFVVWPIGIALGIFAIAAVAVPFLLVRAGVSRGRLAAGGLVLALTIVAAACGDDGNGATPAELTFVDGIATATPDEEHPPQKDVEKPLPCKVEIDALRAGGKITNSSGVPADYLIIVVWEQDGTQLATNTAIIDNVAPGLTSNFEVSAPGEGTLRTTCRVKQIDRRPAD